MSHSSDQPPEDLPAESAEAAEIDKTAEETEIGKTHATPDADEISPLRAMMSQNFLEYASYVIKDRAIPKLDDGLKPVQRRILHSLWEMDDGKFHKVANVVGNTMKYHPHGDASIYNALVYLANKEYFIDKQGNFGNIFTGDAASAARYIECRLSPLAREVLFNPEITEYEDSYDGRNREPLSLPAKVPVLLMQGTDGIAVGMSTRILSHNFNELLNAQIAILRNQPFMMYPDFLQGGIMDVTQYEDGMGKIRLRALIDIPDPKTLIIREIPASTTTESLIASIEDAVNKGKVKIASINDYTAESVEIEIKLPRGIHAEHTIKALYAYTHCEMSISTNCLVIHENQPRLMTVSEILRYNTAKLMDDIKRELEIALGKLEAQFHAKTLVQIFIENRIYQRIEECESNEKIFSEIYAGLAPFRSMLTRDVTDEDVEMLLRIPIRRISLFDINKNKAELDDILQRIEETRHHLAHLRRYTIAYLKSLIKRYGDAYPRRTRIDQIESVNIREIALRNVKVGVDRAGGFIGTAVKSEDPIICTEFDRLLVLLHNGTYKVIPIPDKLYIGPFCAVLKADKSQVYSMIYRDRKTKICFAKRFRVNKYIQEREYASIPKGCRVEKFFSRYGVVLRCEFQPSKRQRTHFCDLDFEDIPVRGATARGLRVAPKVIVKFLQLKRGSDTPPEMEPAPADSPAAAVEPPKDEKDDTEGEAPPAAAALPLPQPGLKSPATLPTLRSTAELMVEDADEQEKSKAGKPKTDVTSGTNPQKTSGKKAKPATAKRTDKKKQPPSPPAESASESPSSPPIYRVDETSDFELES